jgi:hypothetical protein
MKLFVHGGKIKLSNDRNARDFCATFQEDIKLTVPLYCPIQDDLQKASLVYFTALSAAHTL